MRDWGSKYVMRIMHVVMIEGLCNDNEGCCRDNEGLCGDDGGLCGDDEGFCGDYGGLCGGLMMNIMIVIR